MSNTKKYSLIFLILFTHITLLDLFFVTLNGPVFLVEESLQVSTIATHLLITFSSVLIGFITYKARNSYKRTKIKFRNNMLMLGCIFMLFAIFFLLFKT